MTVPFYDRDITEDVMPVIQKRDRGGFKPVPAASVRPDHHEGKPSPLPPDTCREGEFSKREGKLIGQFASLSSNRDFRRSDLRKHHVGAIGIVAVQPAEELSIRPDDEFVIENGIPVGTEKELQRVSGINRSAVPFRKNGMNLRILKRSSTPERIAIYAEMPDRVAFRFQTLCPIQGKFAVKGDRRLIFAGRKDTVEHRTLFQFRQSCRFRKRQRKAETGKIVESRDTSDRHLTVDLRLPPESCALPGERRDLVGEKFRHGPPPGKIEGPRIFRNDFRLPLRTCRKPGAPGQQTEQQNSLEKKPHFTSATSDP